MEVRGRKEVIAPAALVIIPVVVSVQQAGTWIYIIISDLVRLVWMEAAQT